MNFLWLLLLTYTGPEPVPAVPTPASTWEVSYQLDRVLLRPNGESLMFRGLDVYTYDTSGNPIANFQQPFAPDLAFLGPKGSLWIHDGKGRLGRLNPEGGFLWQQEVPPPTIAPVIFGDEVVYVRDTLLELRDPENGTARFSTRRTERISAIKPWGENLLIAHENGEVLMWNPVKESKRIYHDKKKRVLAYVEAGPDGEWALAYRGGHLAVLDKNRKLLWKRDFHIDIACPPVWLKVQTQNGLRTQLLITTQGRRLYAYSPRGHELAGLHLKGRPKALVPWSETSSLLIPSLAETIHFYDALQRKFAKQSLSGYQTNVITAGSFLLLVGKGGIIRLYHRETNM
ncbi:PQQ-like beta-propeller repeat protein [Sulfidibacter corallicola]|uniref:Uncharacterized protein n=1 Tax=Sulfidibacter corallicola TaxID=2818388 RepID=A0A8A4TQ78_SULCO|nr:hypothetical protein [Sulfidibacter corallicola]QTD52136.1 hypothetical protein J3U87_06645 [Sulfidibacter corallicola]